MALVVAVGRALVTDRFKNANTNNVEPTFGAWGTGATAAADGATALSTEGPEARVSGTSSQVTKSGGTTNDTWRLVYTITASAARSVTNNGNFTASSAGTLHMLDSYTALVLATGDSIQFTSEMRTS